MMYMLKLTNTEFTDLERDLRILYAHRESDRKRSEAKRKGQARTRFPSFVLSEKIISQDDDAIIAKVSQFEFDELKYAIKFRANSVISKRKYNGSSNFEVDIMNLDEKIFK